MVPPAATPAVPATTTATAAARPCDYRLRLEQPVRSCNLTSAILSTSHCAPAVGAVQPRWHLLERHTILLVRLPATPAATAAELVGAAEHREFETVEQDRPGARTPGEPVREPYGRWRRFVRKRWPAALRGCGGIVSRSTDRRGDQHSQPLRTPAAAAATAAVRRPEHRSALLLDLMSLFLDFASSFSFFIRCTSLQIKYTYYWPCFSSRRFFDVVTTSRSLTLSSCCSRPLPIAPSLAVLK